jgi:hypothetical protein
LLGRRLPRCPTLFDLCFFISISTNTSLKPIHLSSKRPGTCVPGPPDLIYLTRPHGNRSRKKLAELVALI